MRRKPAIECRARDPGRLNNFFYGEPISMKVVFDKGVRFATCDDAPPAAAFTLTTFEAVDLRYQPESFRRPRLAWARLIAQRFKRGYPRPKRSTLLLYSG
jgi:hypothetical protein